MIGGINADELEEVEAFLLMKGAEKVATPIKEDLHRYNSNFGIASVISSPGGPYSSPFQRGMAVYRPSNGCGSVLAIQTDCEEDEATSTSAHAAAGITDPVVHCPPTPQNFTGKRLRTDPGPSSPVICHQPQAQPRFSANSTVAKEGCPKKLASRQKQIDFGKATLGYARYIAMIPKVDRKRGDPWTPDKNQSCSKRSWDGQARKWRRALHKFDPDAEDAGSDDGSESVESEESVEDGCIDENAVLNQK